MLAVAALLMLNSKVSEAQNQNNLGASCGCTTDVDDREVVDLSSATISDDDGVLIAQNTILTCDKTYLLRKKIYVPAGKIITINPGTVILGRDLNTTAGGFASALIIERGGQIFAIGNPDCPIVFTAEDDLADGVLGNYQNVAGGANGGKWGGIAICGRAPNNLLNGTVTPNNESGIQVGSVSGGTGQPSGTGAIEGISNGEADTRTWFGGIDPNDNSGIMRYVSIRHAGDIILSGNELNSLTLASVGRQTTIDHIEIANYADDGIEVFGGTVNLKYISMIWGDDDGLDWDLGWTGNVQFLFVLNRSTPGNTITDNGIEADGDDGRTNPTVRSHPRIYNGTFIGSNQTAQTGDNSGDAGFNFKEATEGEVYNCIVANYTSGVVIDQVNSSRPGSNNEAYHNWFDGFSTSGTLKIGCNTFVNCTTPLNIEQASVYNYNTTTPASTKFTDDKNVSVSTLSGFDFAYTMNFTNNTVTDKYDAIPNVVPNVTETDCLPPANGFFSQALYRGAFEPGKKSWLSNWTILNIINAGQGIVPCPTDINVDGITNNADFLIFIGEFGQSCD